MASFNIMFFMEKSIKTQICYLKSCLEKIDSPCLDFLIILNEKRRKSEHFVGDFAALQK